MEHGNSANKNEALENRISKEVFEDELYTLDEYLLNLSKRRKGFSKLCRNKAGTFIINEPQNDNI